MFAYDHRTINGTAGISLPAGFSISFNTGTKTMLEKAVRMSNTGTITNY